MARRDFGKKRSCGSCGRRLSGDPSKLQCPHCGEFNVGETAGKEEVAKALVYLEDAKELDEDRIKTGPWDECFGHPGRSGVIRTSVTLLGGARGAGKSTMSLQMADRFAEVTGKDTFYLATEQTTDELKLYASRMGILGHRRVRVLPALHGAFEGDDFDPILRSAKPGAIFVDSLPGLLGSDERNDDTAVQVAKAFKTYAKELNCPVFIIDHVNKIGDFAGLEALQHEVDVLLALFCDDGVVIEGEAVRILSVAGKNRFGPGNASVRLEMTARGLVTSREALLMREGFEDHGDDGGA